MIEENPILYPLELRTDDLAKCSLPIDELIYDNTYCDPIFKFPSREEVFKMIVEIIEKKRKKSNVRVFILIDTLGKEELLISLAQYF